VDPVYWRTPSRSLSDGYGYASYKLREALVNNGINIVDTSDCDYATKGSVTKTLYVNPLSGIHLEPEVRYSGILINNSLPDQYVFDADYVIGFTYWETDTVPSRWLESMRRCDELWTTSEWVGDVFRKTFPDKVIRSFKLGLDTNVFNILHDSPKDDIFYFTHIGSPSTRKNTQLAVDAFKKVFAQKKKYKMIVKSIGPPDARNIINGMNFGSLYNRTDFEIIDYEMTLEELNKLYERSHCLIYPTSGEGWGMIPFQAIGKGIPTICTNATSCTEFAEMSVPLNYKMSSNNTYGIYRGGKWAEPDFDELCDKLYYVSSNYEEVKNKTLLSAKIIQEKYSWDSVSLEYKDRICQILNM
jgi:glycosyltransferase involved in cell wall biosynthesis